MAAEGTLETTTVRLVYDGTICSPALVAEELLRAEGFTDLRYVDMTWIGAGTPLTLANAGADFKLTTPWDGARRIDGGEPIIFLAGIHVGCWELFAREGIGSVVDLKGKSIGTKSAFPSLLYLMAAHVGLDPKQDIRWVTDPAQTPMELFIEGKVDGFLGFPPQPQELRARHVGHVILDTTLDRPWSSISAACW